MRVLRHSQHRARRQYTCSFCMSKINKGDYYFNTVVVDGELYCMRSHVGCQDIANYMFQELDYDDGISPDMFNEFVTEKAIELTNQKHSLDKSIGICINWLSDR